MKVCVSVGGAAASEQHLNSSFSASSRPRCHETKRTCRGKVVPLPAQLSLLAHFLPSRVAWSEAKSLCSQHLTFVLWTDGQTDERPKRLQWKKRKKKKKRPKRRPLVRSAVREGSAREVAADEPVCLFCRLIAIYASL